MLERFKDWWQGFDVISAMLCFLAVAGVVLLLFGFVVNIAIENSLGERAEQIEAARVQWCLDRKGFVRTDRYHLYEGCDFDVAYDGGKR